jgi:small nuclear ribonucleoprotein (snRNP)-like protein
MATPRIVVAVLTLAFCLMASQIFAEEAKFDLTTGAGIKDILKDQTGKRVSIRLDAGEEMEGTVTKVGDQLVHISKLSRRDFYDAVVRIDKISAVILKVRDK